MKAVLNIYFVASLFCVFTAHTHARAKLLPFETARLSQAAGAGAASLLINESTVLNPAAINFFNDSTIYYQRNTEELVKESPERQVGLKDGLSEFYNISDTSSGLKGAFSYVYQNESAGKRRRFALSSAGAIGKKTALGFTAAYIHERSEIKRGTYTQLTFGVTHHVSESLILGFVYVDPTIEISEYSNYRLGLQYKMNQYLTILMDAGSGDVKNPEKSGFTKVAAQIEATDSFFLRYGVFHDKFSGEKGFGYGLSWVGPKFAIEFSLKESTSTPGRFAVLLADEKLRRISFGVTGLF